MFERHSDPIDEASELTASMTENMIQAARRANQPETHPDFDGEHCVDCGDSIVAGRLALGKVRCIVCQEILEKTNSQFAPTGAGAVGVRWDSRED